MEQSGHNDPYFDIFWAKLSWLMSTCTDCIDRRFIWVFVVRVELLLYSKSRRLVGWILSTRSERKNTVSARAFMATISDNLPKTKEIWCVGIDIAFCRKRQTRCSKMRVKMGIDNSRNCDVCYVFTPYSSLIIMQPTRVKYAYLSSLWHRGNLIRRKVLMYIRTKSSKSIWRV